MLNRIEISNFALIENVNLNFKSGYSVITGETGSGKSILLKALNLLLGERADYSVIGNTEKKCIIEAEFDIKDLKLKASFDQWDIDYEEQTVLRREFGANGKSRIFVNDTPATLAVLKALGEKLIKIHSQHQTLDLFSSDFQLETLDAFVGNLAAAEEYKLLFNQFKKNQKQLVLLMEQESKNRKEQDYVSFLINEFEDVKLETIDFDELFAGFDKIENRTKIKTELQYALSSLQDSQETPRALIQKTIDAINEITPFSASYKVLHERLVSLKIELDDIEAEIEHQLSDQEMDEEEAQIITEKVNKINSLLYKHNVNHGSDLLTVKADLETQIAGFSSIEQEINALNKSIADEEKTLKSMAENLDKKRLSGINQFELNVQEILSELGMPDAEIQVNLIKGEALLKSGFSTVDFKFKTNLGGQFLPIAKTVSGGELSRLMLSILNIISTSKKLPAQIFDEIDTGVSGDIAAKIANLFSKMGNNGQIISITHLPQVASKALYHYHVSKSADDTRTNTEARLLTNEERIQELAKMMSGEIVTQKAVENAKSLLKTHTELFDIF